MSRGQERVVALADMDCFYIQVEQRLDPSLRGKPCVVAQYKTWKGGGIIAVSYEARAFGVTRNMWADDAKKLCPDLQVARVPGARGKADLTRYREASTEVMEVMSRFAVIERASIDEAYLDLTCAVQERLKKLNGQSVEPEQLGTTYIQGLPHNPAAEENADNKEKLQQRGVHQWVKSLPFGDPSNPELQLTIGAVIMEEMRAAVESVTGFRCSVGISHNKILAKLACGLNKPNRQTLVSHGAVPQLFSKMPISSIRNLGGKLGASITEHLGVQYMGQLIQFSESQLQTHFGDKTGSWLYELCRGIDYEPVKARQLPKSIGCSKNFRGKTALITQKQVRYWLLQLALELEERLNKDREQNNRVAKQLSIGVHMQGCKHRSGLSRSCALSQYDAQQMSRDAFALIQNCNIAGGQQVTWSPPITGLQLSAGKFSKPSTVSSVDITSFLTHPSQGTQATDTTTDKKDVKPLGSPQKEASKKGVNAIQMLFQRAVERNRGRANTQSSLPGVSETKAPSAAESTICHSSRQIPEDPVEPSNSGLMQKQVSMEESLLEASSTSQGYIPPAEIKMVPCLLKEEKMRSPGLSQGGGENLAAPPAMDDCVLCKKCNKWVAAWEFSEHLDYHFAVELQNSFSGSNSSKPIVSVGKPPRKDKSKSRPHAATSAKRPKQDTNRTLDSFFKPLPS